jgi:Flp pilus assembly protein TadG
MTTARTCRPASNNRGAIIIWLAFILLLMLCFVALGVDVAKLATARTQLQNAADAAALAGASAINPTTGVIDPATATARAQQTGQLNKAFINLPQPVIIDAADVTLLSGQRVKVVARRQGGNSVVAHVAQVLGLSTLQVTATATAEADTTRIAECGIVPLGVNPPPGTSFQTGCGNSYQLKAPGGGGTTGNYGGLDFPACDAGECSGGGASEWRCQLVKGYCCDLTVGQQVQTKPGNMSGPLKTAIDARFDADAVKTENICYSAYVAAGGTGQRVIHVPIVSPFPNGSSAPVTITGFTAFFIKNKPGSGADSSLEGEFIYDVIPGTGGGSGSGAVAFSVHLVPNP